LPVGSDSPPLGEPAENFPPSQAPRRASSVARVSTLFGSREACVDIEDIEVRGTVPEHLAEQANPGRSL
jgi:hypothetical protein